MNIGFRALLLVAAVAVFVIAIFVDIQNQLDWISIGLACSAGAVLVSEMGWDRPVMGGRSSSSSSGT